MDAYLILNNTEQFTIIKYEFSIFPRGSEFSEYQQQVSDGTKISNNFADLSACFLLDVFKH